MSDQPKENSIWASSFVSHITRKGMVSLRISEGSHEHEVQLTVEQAREVSTNIARAAEAAETDEMVLALLGVDTTGLHVIRLMREYREAKLGIKKAEWTPEEIAKKIKEPPPEAP